MTSKIGIPIEAQFDTKGAEAAIDKLSQKIEQSNKTQLSPVSDKTLGKIDAVNNKLDSVGKKVVQQNRTKLDPVSDKAVSNATKLLEVLKRVNPELNRRINASGQAGVPYEDLDLKRAGYSRHRISQIQKYVGDPGAGQGGNGSVKPPGMLQNAVHAGLSAAGPAGSVASKALGTGMSAGAGAGLMGLMGGMLALGVGKAVSGVMEKMDQAEGNAIAYDKLKRTLGDVGVSFNGLKAAVEGGAKNLSITFDESARLSTQFAKLANLSSAEYKSIPDELKTGVGLSRGFGLDPSQGIGVMGQMRGLGVTKDAQDSRRFALLIGETIGKSGAFAKADEVMDAMASYATQQTRSSMGGANVSGYAGTLSALVGSGIPGMDPAGAASLLSRINSALSSGGAKGEASQFFTGQVGYNMGLNPLQTQVMREGGAFATNDTMFGKGSAYERYMGKTGPKGGATFLQGTMDMLRQQMPGEDDQSKLMRAQAFANHAGVNMNQAMGMLSIKPNQMKEMEKYAGDLTKLSGSGISNMSKALYGSADERKDLAKGYLARTGKDAISSEDRKAIEGAAGNDAALRDALGRIAGKYDQERTQGSDIRDSKNTLDNILTEMAGTLIPVTQQIRHGIMYMAGAKDGKSPREVMEEVLRAEGKDKLSGVKSEFAGKQSVTQDAVDKIAKQKEKLTLEFRKQYGAFTNSPEEYYRQMKELADKEAVATEANNKAKAAYTKAIELAKQELDDSITDLRKGLPAGTTSGRRNAPDPSNESQAERNRLIRHGTGGSGSVMPGGMGALSTDPAFLAKVAANEDEIGAPRGLLRAQLEQESRFHPNAVSPAGARGLGQIMPSTQRALEKRLGRSMDPFNPDDSLLMQKEVMRENYAKFGNWDDATSAYNGGWSKGRWGNKETAEYTPAIRNRMNRYSNTPMPEGSSLPGLGGGAQNFSLTAAPVVLEFVNPPKELVMPKQGLQFKLGPAQPFGSRS